MLPDEIVCIEDARPRRLAAGVLDESIDGKLRVELREQLGVVRRDAGTDRGQGREPCEAHEVDGHRVESRKSVESQQSNLDYRRSTTHSRRSTLDYRLVLR